VEQFDTDFFQHNARLFLQKPYTRYTLAQAVRECLDQGWTVFELNSSAELTVQS
jgi:hypothetical protein